MAVKNETWRKNNWLLQSTNCHWQIFLANEWTFMDFDSWRSIFLSSTMISVGNLNKFTGLVSTAGICGSETSETSVTWFSRAVTTDYSRAKFSLTKGEPTYLKRLSFLNNWRLVRNFCLARRIEDVKLRWKWDRPPTCPVLASAGIVASKWPPHVHLEKIHSHLRRTNSGHLQSLIRIKS